MTWLKQFPTECWWERLLCWLIFIITFTLLFISKRFNWNEPQCCFNWVSSEIITVHHLSLLHSNEIEKWNNNNNKNAFKSNKNEIHDLSLIRFNNVLHFKHYLAIHQCIGWHCGVMALTRSLIHSFTSHYVNAHLSYHFTLFDMTNNLHMLKAVVLQPARNRADKITKCQWI